MTPILNKSLPDAPWLTPSNWRLPGTRPVSAAEWLCADDVFSDQMALRDGLLADRYDDVHAMLDGALPAAQETLDRVLGAIGENPDYTIHVGEVERPDGKRVRIDRSRPLATAGRLVQEDLCLLEDDGTGTYRLTAALLCFPASWTLSEKIGKSLVGLHGPITAYTDDIALRVQRMFENLRPGIILTRSNALLYNTPMLHVPRREAEHSADSSPEGRFLRSERQALQRLPESGAVLFSIHTFVLALEDLTRTQRETLDQVRTRMRNR